MDKAKVYGLLISHYKFTCDEIADMTPAQMMLCLKAINSDNLSTTKTFSSFADYLAWKATNG